MESHLFYMILGFCHHIVVLSFLVPKVKLKELIILDDLQK